MGILRAAAGALACSALATNYSPNTALPQSKTNGDSLLGTLDAPTYPKFLTNNPLPDGTPWGTKTAYNSDPYHDAPNTGVTRYYDWTISDVVLYPDGYEKDMIVVNNAFPGPIIEANWGDMISVTVRNNITGHAPQQTSLHWHGFLQHNSQWNDGSPGLTQCPIAPGDSFTYTMKAELYGTTWWHGHLSGQWVNGLQGPMIIYGPSSADYDIDIGPVEVFDWYHRPAEEVQLDLLQPRGAMMYIGSDNNLINGKHPYPCEENRDPDKECLSGAPYAEFEFEAGKVHRLRLINSGAQAVQYFSIDDHEMTIIANDFMPVEPYNTTMVTLGVGQRTDVLVYAGQDPSQTYWMRTRADCAETTHPESKAIITYVAYNSTTSNTASSGTSSDGTASIASSGNGRGGSSDRSWDHNNRDDWNRTARPNNDDSHWVDLPVPSTWPMPDATNGRNPICGNDPLELTVPAYKIPVKPPTVTETFTMSLRQNATGSWVWWMNNISYLSDFDNPTLNLLATGNISYLVSQPKRVPYFVPDGATSYRFILDNKSPGPHPMHMHGHNIFVLYVSTSPWDESLRSQVDSLVVRPENPQRRDVQQVPAGGYVVIQVTADNPGSWGLHCHMAFHIGGGFMIDVVEGKDKFAGTAIPDEVQRTCSNWKRFSYGPDYTDAWTIDSGQKV